MLTGWKREGGGERPHCGPTAPPHLHPPITKNPKESQMNSSISIRNQRLWKCRPSILCHPVRMLQHLSNWIIHKAVNKRSPPQSIPNPILKSKDALPSSADASTSFKVDHPQSCQQEVTTPKHPKSNIEIEGFFRDGGGEGGGNGLI